MPLVRPPTVQPVKVKPVGVSGIQTDRNPNGAAATIASDSFTRADSAVALGTSDSGHLWTAHTGTWGISGNKGYLVTDSGSNNLATLDSTKADCTVAVTLSGTFNGGALTFRFVDTSNFFIAYADGNNVTVYQNVATSFTLIGTTAYIWSAGDVLSVTLSGQNIDAKVNGVSKVTGTSAAHTSATRHGLFTSPSPDPSARWDNFLVTVP